jgi:hypothetical protein
MTDVFWNEHCPAGVRLSETKERGHRPCRARRALVVT